MQYNMRDCGARILWLRRNADFSQNELAEKLNISPEHYRAVESGRHGCSIDLLVDLATLFDVSLDYLVLGRRLHSDSNSIRDKLLELEDALSELRRSL